MCAFDLLLSFNRSLSVFVDYAFRSDSDSGSFILQPNMNTFKQTYDMHREFLTFAVLQYSRVPATPDFGSFGLDQTVPKMCEMTVCPTAVR